MCDDPDPEASIANFVEYMYTYSKGRKKWMEKNKVLIWKVGAAE